MDDLELLRQYSEQGSQAAFSELVGRYVDLVYSAARRQVWSDQLAEEITQAVFLDLAQHAEKLRPSSHLGSWLYVVARRTSVDAIRRESRRQKREQAAVEGAALNSASPWSKVEPVLDESISSLGETDRRAILLRFFEKKSFSEIGRMLGGSEEAAQKRVRRAVERLRESLARRGVAATTAVLTAEIAPHAVQGAPSALGETVASAVALAHPAAQQAILYQSAHSIAMTFAQKTAVTALLLVAVAGGWYQNNLIRRQAHEAAALGTQVANEREQIRQLNHLREITARELAEARHAAGKSDVADGSGEAGDPTAAAMRSWLVRVGQLREQMERRPGQKIPELKFVTDEDWFDATKTGLETDGDYRRALAKVRSAGENKFMWQIQPAVNKYAESNAGQFPSDISQLAPYFASQEDVGMLQRYVVAPAKAVPSVGMGGDQIITQKIQVDAQYDTDFVLGLHGYGSSTPGPEVGAALQSLINAYAATNNARLPSDPAQLIPFATTPDQQVALQKALLRSGLK